jgi:hypothetical protein
MLVYKFESEDESRTINKLDNGKYYRPYQVVNRLTGLSTAHAAK